MGLNFIGEREMIIAECDMARLKSYGSNLKKERYSCKPCMPQSSISTLKLSERTTYALWENRICNWLALLESVQSSSLLTPCSRHHIQFFQHESNSGKAVVSSFPVDFLAPDYRFSLKSTTLLLALSRLPRTPLLELLELPLRLLLASSGSVGCSPLALANRFRISVKLTTPFNLPDMCCPGIAEADTEGVALRGWKGGLACGNEVERCGGWMTGGCAMEMGAAWVAGPGPGVEGAEEEGVEDGVGVSTTHILGNSQCVDLDRSVEKDGKIRIVLPVGCCSNELCDCMSEGGLGVYVEDRIRVFAVNHSAGGKDDGDEVYAGVFEKRC